MTTDQLKEAIAIRKEIEEAEKEISRWQDYFNPIEIVSMDMYRNSSTALRMKAIPGISTMVRDMYIFYWSQRINALESQLASV